MSGKRVSVVLRYGVAADSSFWVERSMVWPLLRTLPNNTHASLMQRFAFDVPKMLIVNGRSLSREVVSEIRLFGMLQVTSTFHIGIPNTRAAIGQRSQPAVELTRLFFPSPEQPMLCERYLLTNISERPITLSVPDSRMVYHTDPEKGVEGAYTLIAALHNSGTVILAPGAQYAFDGSVQAFSSGQQEAILRGQQEAVLSRGFGQQEAVLNIHRVQQEYEAVLRGQQEAVLNRGFGQQEAVLNMDREQQEREALIAQWRNQLRLETSDEVINTAFAFAKIRASESIYATKGGPMHGPGGESYYAALWANDQAEYINPFFPFLGYDYGNESAFNSFQHFARFMNPHYEPIPSSIIAEGLDIWNGAGDRGDAAMIAYGAARYALARGDRIEAERLWPLIEWCLEYCRRKLNHKGVVTSDTDELEGRFPSGSANLCTSSLYYDALCSAAFLGAEVGKKSLSAKYKREANALKKAIEAYFGANVEGFDTYRYYEGNDILRSWICIPLTVGIYDRAPGTIAALFSPRLWTENGLLTLAGDRTFWDRSTLYALRGVFAAGETERALEYLTFYSRQRLLGEHVPYPIEAWPEGNQRHLSAESGLYCRIITEGIFGIRPTGLRSFSITPRLPQAWNNMALRGIHAFGRVFDVEVTRAGKKLELLIRANDQVVVKKEVQSGAAVEVTLP